MSLRKTIVAVFIITLFSACASVPPGSENPYAGRYVGVEVLEGGTNPGGTFPLRINISDSGRVTVIDEDDIRAHGKMEGNKFVASRPSPKQVFFGEIVGNKITGTTKDNPFMGPGTFEATLR